MKTKTIKIVEKTNKFVTSKDSNYNYIWSESGKIDSSSHDPKIAINKKTKNVAFIYDSRSIEMPIKQMFEVIWSCLGLVEEITSKG